MSVSDGLVPARMLREPVNGTAVTAIGPDVPPQPQASTPRVLLARYLAVLRRHKWLMLGVVVVGAIGGFVATRFVNAKYDARATIWISSETPLADQRGPIRSGELLSSKAWVELLRSYRIADAVVRKHALFVKPEKLADSAAFHGFNVGDRFVPGEFELEIKPEGRRRRYQLYLRGMPVETGMVGDSIGRRLGFHWAPTVRALRATGKRSLEFTVHTPREASLELMKRLTTRQPDQSNFLWLSLSDDDPQKAASILNTWVREYVAVAGELKKRNIVEFSSILGGQLSFAEKSLKDAEAALERFRVNTITLPNEEAPIVAGLEMTRNPALNAYFSRKFEHDNLRHDREALASLIARSKASPSSLEGALLLPTVAQGGMAEQLRDAFRQLYQRRAELSAARHVYTDEVKGVKDLVASIEELETKTIPAIAERIHANLTERESQAESRIETQSVDLQEIPTRTIEEMRLRRRVTVAEGLYATLQSRHAEARLAEASTTPDISILDSAVAPLRPTKDTALGLFGMVVLGSLGAALALALLVERFDGKVRYPEHATHELGLLILGTVPNIEKSRQITASPEAASGIVESFRSIRMHLVNAVAGAPFSVAVTSAGAGEGKSLVCANLALSFVEAGFRTILVDGDVRRGSLHHLFGAKITAGLTDYLAGEAGLNDVVHPTKWADLAFVPRGSRRRTGPEMLTSASMQKLVTDLCAKADVVLFDTPPLAAGIDAYAIGAAAQNVVTVLRVGQTDRRLAGAKLELVDRLPVRSVGAVLNDVPIGGEYQYYGYLDGYYVDDDAARGRQLVAQG